MNFSTPSTLEILKKFLRRSLTGYLSMEIGIQPRPPHDYKLELKLIVQDRKIDLFLPRSSLDARRRQVEVSTLPRRTTIKITLRPSKYSANTEAILREVLHYVLMRGRRLQNICIPSPLIDAEMLNKSIPDETLWLSLHLFTLRKFKHFHKLAKVKHLGIYLPSAMEDLLVYGFKMNVEGTWLNDLEFVVRKVVEHMTSLVSLSVSGFLVPPGVLEVLQYCFGRKLQKICLHFVLPARNSIEFNNLHADVIGRPVEETVEDLNIYMDYHLYTNTMNFVTSLNGFLGCRNLYVGCRKASLTDLIRNSTRWPNFNFPDLKAVGAMNVLSRADELLDTIATLFSFIKEINLVKCGRFSSSAVAEIFRNCQKLQFFNLTDVGFDYQDWIFYSIPLSLKALTFKSCIDVSEERVKRIRARHPRIKVSYVPYAAG